MRISAALLSRYKKGPLILSDGRSLSHRMLVIQSACDLEVELRDLLVAFARRSNPGTTDKQARDFLLGDGRPFDSFKRAADAAVAFGLISVEANADLKVLGRMRDRYAHDRERDQLERDPEMLKMMHSLKLWKANKELHERKPQEAFRCIAAHLNETIRLAVANIAISP